MAWSAWCQTCEVDGFNIVKFCRLFFMRSYLWFFCYYFLLRFNFIFYLFWPLLESPRYCWFSCQCPHCCRSLCRTCLKPYEATHLSNTGKVSCIQSRYDYIASGNWLVSHYLDINKRQARGHLKYLRAFRFTFFLYLR